MYVWYSCTIAACMCAWCSSNLCVMWCGCMVWTMKGVRWCMVQPSGRGVWQSCNSQYSIVLLCRCMVQLQHTLLLHGWGVWSIVYRVAAHGTIQLWSQCAFLWCSCSSHSYKYGRGGCDYDGAAIQERYSSVVQLCGTTQLCLVQCKCMAEGYGNAATCLCMVQCNSVVPLCNCNSCLYNCNPYAAV